MPNEIEPLSHQVGGTHYKVLKIQPIEFINRNKMDFNSGSVVKYTCRHKDKNGLQDILKALHYCDFIDHYGITCFGKLNKELLEFNRKFIAQFGGDQRLILEGIVELSYAKDYDDMESAMTDIRWGLNMIKNRYENR